jgi:hypothetical protein
VRKTGDFPWQDPGALPPGSFLYDPADRSYILFLSGWRGRRVLCYTLLHSSHQQEGTGWWRLHDLPVWSGSWAHPVE